MGKPEETDDKFCAGEEILCDDAIQRKEGAGERFQRAFYFGGGLGSDVGV